MAPKGRPGLHHLTLQQVPEPKTAKVRGHLDLFFTDLDAAVTRLEGHGATILAPDVDDACRSVVMADPEGNEFCALELPRREG